MYNFSKWGKHFIKLITIPGQSFTFDIARTFKLLTTTAVMLAIVFDP